MKKLMILLQIVLILSVTACGGGGGEDNKEPYIAEFTIDGRTDLTAEAGGREILGIEVVDDEGDEFVYSVLARDGVIEQDGDTYYYVAPADLGTDRLSILIEYGVNKVVNCVMDIQIVENQPEITYMIYMGADSNLNGGTSQAIYDEYYDYAKKDLTELENRTVSNNDINVVAYVDYLVTNDGGAGIYKLTNTGFEKVVDVAEPNTGEKESLTYFIDYVATNFAANKYILGLWGHGDGWRLELNSDKRMVVPDYSSDNDGLNLYELEEAIVDSQISKFDLIAFDACLMGGIETAYQLENLCDYIVFSPEITPTTGFAYTEILDYVSNNHLAPIEEIAKKMVELTVASYAVGGSQYEAGTLEAVVYSVAKQSKLSELVAKSDEIFDLIEGTDILELVEALRYKQGALENDYVMEYDKINSYSDRSFYVDFGDLFIKMKTLSTIDDTLRTKIDELLSVYQEYIIYVEYQNGFYYDYIDAYEGGTTGLSIFIDFTGRYSSYIDEYVAASKYGAR